jgi:hypothetical protein
MAVILASCGGGSSKSRSGTTTPHASPTTAQPAGTNASAGSTTTTVGPLTQAQLQSALLTVTDLPTGWSTTPPSTNKKGLCNKASVNKAVPPAATTEADFVMGREIPFFGEQLLSYADDSTAARALDKYQSNASSCTTFEQDGVKVDVGQLSMPPLGDRTIGYRLTLHQGGASVILDTAVIQRGPLIVYTGYGDLSADTEQLVTFTKLAYDKAVNTLKLG